VAHLSKDFGQFKIGYCPWLWLFPTPKKMKKGRRKKNKKRRTKKREGNKR